MNPEEIPMPIRPMIELPRPPEDLWMLWDVAQGRYLLAADDAPDGPTYLVALSATEASIAARYQNDLYGVNCISIRVKGGGASHDRES